MIPPASLLRARTLFAALFVALEQGNRCRATRLLDSAAAHLSHARSELAPGTTPARLLAIQHATAAAFGYTPAQLTGPLRTAPLIIARHTAIYLCRILTTYGCEVIGAAFGGRQHTTITYACRTMEDRIQHEPQIAARVAHARSIVETALRSLESPAPASAFSVSELRAA